MSASSHKVYQTAFTHSVSLTELEHVPRALICVDSTGVIEWIEKDIGDEEVDKVLADHGMTDVEVIKIDQGGLVPGLIDTHTVCLSRSRDVVVGD
jgi:cytosine/adenosine deaminase-related metal-dependent hydrolase